MAGSNKDKMSRTSQKGTIKKLLMRLRKYRFFLIGSILAASVTVATTLYVPILIGKAIDNIVGSENVDFEKIFYLLAKVAVIICITGIFQWIMNVCNNKVTYHMTRDIRNEAIEKLEILPLKYIDGHSHGDIVSRVIADVDQFADGLLMGFTQFFTGVVTIFGTLGFMFSINVKIALIVVVLTPISLLVARFIANHTYSMFKLQSEIRGEQTALINEMIGGQKEVKAFGYEKEALRRFDDVNKRLQTSSTKAIFYSSLTNPSTRFVNSLVFAGVAISGAIFAVYGRLSVGQLSCFLSYANQYTKPFNEISGVITELQNALACVTRIFELIEEEPQIPDAEEGIILSDVEGKVNLTHVDFSYTL
ncbi:MAG TPA: ABC transporter ATP-binding protein, partial [Clostridia bacterium]|nr:ABC transporter ATP-binding protein [Clostridia bacterium]